MTELTQAEIEQVNGGLLDLFSGAIGLFNGLGSLLNKVGPLLNSLREFFDAPATKNLITAVTNFFRA